MYISKLDDIVNDYNNIYHSTIKMKSVEVKSSTYTDFGIENNEKAPKFKVGDNVRISNIKRVLQKVILPIRLKKTL